MEHSKSKTRRIFHAVTPLVILCATIIGGCSNTRPIVTPNTEVSWMTQDKDIMTILGDSVFSTILFPDKVECFTLKPDSSNTGNDKGSYIIDSLICTLNSGQTAVLQYLLPANRANYETDTIRLQSPFLPHLSFQFCKHGFDTIRLTISPISHSWMLDGINNDTIYNYVESTSIERFCNCITKMPHHK